MKKSALFIAFITFCTILIISVLYYINIMGDAIESINPEYVYGKMVSKKYKGRLAGSEDVKASEKLLSDIFGQYQLEAENDTYYQEFDYFFYDTQKDDAIIVEIIDNFGKTINLKYGVDYSLRSFCNNVNIDIPINIDTNNKIITKFVDYNEYNINVLVEKKDDFSVPKLSKNNTIIVELNSKTYDKLLDLVNSNKQLKLSINCNIDEKLVTDNNIIGKISSSKIDNSSKLIVISAHFDHIGTLANNTYYGSLDNASGVYCLLNIIEELKLKLSTSKIDCDIIFALFNAEEFDRIGSKSFVKKYSDKYENIININLDCISGKNKDQIYVTGNGSTDQYADSISKLLCSKGYSIKYKDLVSDDLTFRESGYMAVNISQGELEDIHTIRDKENLDLDGIRTLSSALAHNINEIALSFDDFSTKELTMQDEAKLIFEEGKKLEFNEYKFIFEQMKLIFVFNNTKTFSPYEYEEFFTDKKIVFNNNRYVLSGITVMNDYQKIRKKVMKGINEALSAEEYEKNIEKIINTVYKLDNSESIFSIEQIIVHEKNNNKFDYIFSKKYYNPDYFVLAENSKDNSMKSNSKEIKVENIRAVECDGYKWNVEYNNKNECIYIYTDTSHGPIFLSTINNEDKVMDKLTYGKDLEALLHDISNNIDLNNISEYLYSN